MHKSVALFVTAGILVIQASHALAGDPNGTRPGLTQPPAPSLREPAEASVPEGGSSLVLLGAALVALASGRYFFRKSAG